MIDPPPSLYSMYIARAIRVALIMPIVVVKVDIGVLRGMVSLDSMPPI